MFKKKWISLVQKEPVQIGLKYWGDGDIVNEELMKWRWWYPVGLQ